MTREKLNSDIVVIVLCCLVCHSNNFQDGDKIGLELLF